MTAEEILAESRERLDDKISPYLWSDEEIINTFLNNAETNLCERCLLLEEAGVSSGEISVSFTASTKKIARLTGSFLSDGYMEEDEIKTNSTTNPGPFTIASVSALDITTNEALVNETAATHRVGTSISTIFVVEDTPVYITDSRIVRIQEAILSLQTRPLFILRNNALGYMGSHYSSWRSADSRTPTMLIIQGVGKNRVRLYAPSDVDETMLLTVYRRPRIMLSVSDKSKSPEISEEFHKYLFNWIMYEAYSKNDTDTESQPKAKNHLALYETVDIPAIQKMLLRRDYQPMTNAPHSGVM